MGRAQWIFSVVCPKQRITTSSLTTREMGAHLLRCSVRVRVQFPIKKKKKKR